MEKNATLNIAVCLKLEPEHYRKLAAVDPRVRAYDVFPYLSGELKNTYFYTLGLTREPANLPPPDEARLKMDEALKQTEVLYGIYFPRDLARRAPNLRWIQRSGAGVEGIAASGPLDGVIVTNASGMAAASICEHVFCMILMFTRQAGRWMDLKKAGKWERFSSPELSGQTLGVVGMGAIGSRVAAVGKAFGMKVLAIKRSATSRRKNVEGVDELMPASDLHRLLGQADYVVLSVPLTAETRQFFDAAAVKAMKPTARLINISRGGVIDEPALIAALKERKIAGAGLDVFQKEPLPPESELWGMDNVIMTPHIAGVFDGYRDRSIDIFCDNIKRYLNGEKLNNLVDLKLGY